MAMDVLKQTKAVPLSVLRAKARGDTAELSRLGRLGNVVKKERREWFERQGVLPFGTKPASSGARRARKPHTAEERKAIAETRYINSLRRQELAAIALADAQDHADETVAGWCED